MNPIFKELKLIVIHSINVWCVKTQIRNIEWVDFVESSIELWEIRVTRTETFNKNDKDIVTTDENSLDPQWVWSSISYYRRYNLLTLLDLEQVDDDAKTWSNRAKTKDYWESTPPSSEESDLGTCDSCWAPMKMSKAGKPYCSATCWK